MKKVTRTQRASAAKPKLERVAFTTSRLAEFVGEKELVAQIGHRPEEWPLVIAKEVIDNALDEAEEAEIAPEIEVAVSTETGEIVITDNGRGLPAETLAGVLDYTVRVSSREAYVSPSRGRQGNALKCLIAMPFALDGTHGTTIIETQGQGHRVAFETDPIRCEPRIEHEIGPSDVKTGTRITVHWPRIASDALVAAQQAFSKTVCNFTTFNPHLTLRGCWNDEEFLDHHAADPAWRKWRACDPTSAHWYGGDQFARYIAAHIARDEDHGRIGRTVRDFISELRGLSGSGKQKLVLAETAAAGITLAEYFKRGPDAIADLLTACQQHTKPVKPENLGLIGAAHLEAECLALGGAPASFRYRKCLGTTTGGLPYVVEAAFAYCPHNVDEGLRLISGVNFSIGIGSPFERLGSDLGLTSALANRYVRYDDPVIFVLHFACPEVEFADRGKGMLALPRGVTGEIIGLVESVTKAWTKQRRAELRHQIAELNRDEWLLRRHRIKPEPPAPTGILAQQISREASRQAVSIDELRVLSRDNDPYTAFRRRPEAEWFARLFNRLVPTGTEHLRGFFYLLVSTPRPIPGPKGDRFVNDYDHWQMVQRAAKAARWLGLIRFERIIDERNPEPEIFVPGVTPITTGMDAGTSAAIPETVKDAVPKPRLDGFTGRQTHRIIFYGEKSSLAPLLRPIAEQIGAEMILVTGESSDRRIAEMAERAHKDGRPAVVLYFSDFDPSGHEMPANVARKLQALRDLYYRKLDIKLYQVALTLEQCVRLNLPSSPLKATEKRAARWYATYGREQTEIDAMVRLHPESLRQATYVAIQPFYDKGLDARVADVENQWQKEAAQKLRADPAYHETRRRIAAIHNRLSKAAEELHDEQRELTKKFQDIVPAQPALPAAAPDGKAKPPLFDSDSDFVTATRRLRRHKRYDNEDDRPDGKAPADEDEDLQVEADEPSTPEPPLIRRPRGISPLLETNTEPTPPVRRPPR